MMRTFLNFQCVIAHGDTMPIALGVINHSPDFMLSRLRKRLKLRYAECFTVVDELPEEKAKLLVFLNTFSFRNAIPILNTPKYDKTICVVHGSPMELHNFNTTPFDYALSEDIHLDGFVFTPFNVNALTQNITIKYAKYDFLKEVLDKVQSFTGILTQLMTFVYTMPKSTHQKPIKELACMWLAHNENEAQLDERITKALNYTPLHDKQIKRLKAILISPNAELYKKAIKATMVVKDMDSDEFVRIVSSFKVSAYEIRYIRSVTKNLK